MAVNTILMDLSVDPAKIVGENSLKPTIKETLSKFISDLKEIHSSNFESGGFICVLTAERDSFITIRGFPKGLVSINIEYYRADGEEPLLTFERFRKMESQMRFALSSTRSKLFPPVRRGARFDVYLNSSDERILEYDIDNLVFEENSPYQKVQVVHSRSLGNMLVLDELQNMSEKDLIYTETLMQRGKEDYKDKEIVILGGGDGCLLWELLKEKPKFVTMLELDEVVIKACSKHLRSACGDCLDQLEGPNYKIVIGDCVKTIDDMINSGKKVDYVFGDLTDIPVSTSPRGEIWDFIRLILNKATQILKPNGKYLTHGNGASCPKALAMYEDQLKNLKIPVEFTTDKAFVPSFLEEWVFYQVWPKQVN